MRFKTIDDIRAYKWAGSWSDRDAEDALDRWMYDIANPEAERREAFDLINRVWYGALARPVTPEELEEQRLGYLAAREIKL